MAFNIQSRSGKDAQPLILVANISVSRFMPLRLYSSVVSLPDVFIFGAANAPDILEARKAR